MTPTPPGSTGPVVGWQAPDEPEGLGIGETRREGWRLARAHLGTYAAITAVPVVLLNLCLLPIWLSTGQMLERMFTFWSTLDFSRYRTDPEGLQRDMQAAMQPSSDLALLGAIGTGVAILVMFIGFAALSAAVLDAVAGRRPTIGGAYRAVGRQLGTVIVPALVLAVGYVAIVGPLTLNQATFTSIGTTPTRAALGAVLGLTAFVIEVVAFYLAIRWALYFQVVLDEDGGFRSALSRSSTLTHRIRIKLGLIFIVWALAVGLVVGLVGLTAALVVGIAAGSLLAGLIGYTVAISVCGLVYVPFYVGMLTGIYRHRLEATAPDPSGPAGPAGTEPADG